MTSRITASPNERQRSDSGLLPFTGRRCRQAAEGQRKHLLEKRCLSVL
ncbi:hypothetical protein X737_16650 [Mesorhizobium sp. L48C026A00]|nr:hypothetical protein X737_16650 [Mesorhizobium sp. L48C026A00]